MGKMKIAPKEIQEGYKNIIRVGFCGLQTLLRYKEPKFYTANNKNGHNADIYEIDNHTCIVTGGCSFGNIEKYDLCNEYELKAQKLLDYRTILSYDEKVAKMDELLAEFVEKCIND